MIARPLPAARIAASERRRLPFLRDILAMLAGLTLGAGMVFGGTIVHAEHHRQAGCHRCASHGIIPT